MKLSLSPLRFLLLCVALACPSLASAQDAAAGTDPESDLTGSAPADAAEPDAAPAEEATESEAAEAAPVEAAPAEAVPEETAPAETATPEPATDAGATEAEALAAPTDEGEASATPADEGEAGAAAADAPPPEPSPFRGSLFSWQQSLSVNTLNPDAQLTYNPTYYWTFFLQPRFYLDRQNFLVLSLGASIEWTDNDFSTIERQFLLTDTTLEYRHLEVIEGFVFIPSVRLTAPTSLASIANETILTAGAGLTVVKVFPELASFTIAATGAYRHRFGLTNVAVTHDEDAPRCSTTSLVEQSCQAGAFTSGRDTMIAALTMTVMPVPGLTILTQYAGAWIYGEELRTEENPAVGGPSELPDASASHWRNGHYFTVAVGYDVVPWLNLQLGYQGSPGFTPWLNQSGNVQNPFYYFDSELYLSATIALDVMVDEIVGGDEDGGLTPEQLQRRRQGLASRGAGLAF